MSNTTTTMTCVATCLLVLCAGSTAAMGQTTQEIQKRQAQPTEAVPSKSASLHFMLSQDVLGATLVDAAGESAGTINDVIIHAQSAKLQYAIISVGGVFGLGDKLIAVPFDQVHWSTTSNAFVLGMSPDKLTAMPAFEAKRWNELERKDWEETLVKHADASQVVPSRTVDEPSKSKTGTGSMSKTLIRLSDISGSAIKATSDDSKPTSGSSNRKVTLEGDRKQIGEIDGAILELTTAKAPFVIISTGGILGFGEDDRVAPWSSMTMSSGDLLLANISTDQFEDLKVVKKSDIEKMHSAKDVEGWYTSFNVKPDDFTDDETDPASGGG